MENDSMKKIPRQEFVDKHLDFTEIVDSEGHQGIKKIRYVVIDIDGEIYDGVLNEDGSFNDGFTIWENAEVYERFGRFSESANPIANKYMSRWYSETIYYNDVTGEFFLLMTYPSASTCFISSLSPIAAVRWFVDLGNYDELRIPDAPYIGIVLTDELMRRVTQAASVDGLSAGGWVLDRIKQTLGAASADTLPTVPSEAKAPEAGATS
jgi:hypothetical protein